MKLVKRVEIPKPDVTYNLHVEKNHNYVANGAVVKNCHGSKANKLFQLLTEHGNNIVHRYGLTGTLPDNPVDKLSVHLALGPVLCTYSAKSLIDKGWLATLSITIMELNDIKFLESNNVHEPHKLMYEEENHFCKTNITRMKWIANLIIENRNKNKMSNTLILVNNIKFGKSLCKLIPGSFALNGSDSEVDRRAVYDLFEEKDDVVAICTKQIAGVGLSIDRIFTLVFIDSGKSFIGTIQSIGRGLRKGKDKEFVNVIDICSNMHSAHERMLKRRKYYKNAQYPNSTILVNYTNESTNESEDE